MRWSFASGLALIGALNAGCANVVEYMSSRQDSAVASTPTACRASGTG